MHPRVNVGCGLQSLYWMMTLHVEDGVPERTQHGNGDTKGIPIIYAEYVPPTVSLLLLPASVK